MSVATIQSPVPPPSSSLETTPNAFNSNLPLGRADKYRGASVEVRIHSCSMTGRVGVLTRMQDLQLPPAFCLSQLQLVARAIELAYERDYSHIPYVSFSVVYPSALDIDRGGLIQYILAWTRVNNFPLNGVCLNRTNCACCAIPCGYGLIPSTNPVPRPAT
jgi:hypothetical protein